MKEKNVVITGATSGLGRATALELARKGACVVGVARNPGKADSLVDSIKKDGGRVQIVISDLLSMKETRSAARQVATIVERVDVLINNAGAYFPKYKKTAEGFESTLALNYLSPFLFTHHLLHHVGQTASRYGEARIINISSIMHKAPINWSEPNYSDENYRSTTAYYQSKHMLTSFTYYVSDKVKHTGITVNCVHPGFVKTALAKSDYPFPMNLIVPIVGFFIGESPEQAADTPVWLASSDEVRSISGQYVHHRRVKKSWPPTRDKNAQKRLFKMTQSMVEEWL